MQVPCYQICELLEARQGLEHWTGLDWALHNKNIELVRTILEHVIHDPDPSHLHHDIMHQHSDDSQISDVTHRSSMDDESTSDIVEGNGVSPGTTDMKLFRLVFPAACWLGDVHLVKTILKQVSSKVGALELMTEQAKQIHMQ